MYNKLVENIRYELMEWLRREKECKKYGIDYVERSAFERSVGRYRYKNVDGICIKVSENEMSFEFDEIKRSSGMGELIKILEMSCGEEEVWNVGLVYEDGVEVNYGIGFCGMGLRSERGLNDRMKVECWDVFWMKKISNGKWEDIKKGELI